MDVKWAKEHFLKYDGSYFHMTREGDIRRYKEYGISREQEKEWIRAHQQELIKKFETEKDIIPTVLRFIIRLCSTVSTFMETTILSSMIDVLKTRETYLDSYSLSLISKNILQMVENFFNRSAVENSSIIDAKRYAIDLLHKVINNPITVDSYYIQSVYFKDVLKEESIINEARDLLSRWE